MKKTRILKVILGLFILGIFIVSCPPPPTPLTLTVNSTTGGTTTPSGTSNAEEGRAYPVSAEPETDYNFSGWTIVEGTGAHLEDSTSVTTFITIGNENCILQAEFESSTVAPLPVITISASSGGTVTPLGSQSVNPSESLSLSITPDDCYEIEDVLVDGESVGTPGEYEISNITENHTVEVSFTLTEYSINILPGNGGNTAPQGVQMIDCGGNLSVTFNPDGSHELRDVLVDGASVGAVSPYNFTDVRANHTIQGVYEVLDYTITASAETGGTISPAGSTAVSHGGTVNYTITADSCYNLIDVLIDGASVGPTTMYSFSNVTANHTIYARFTRRQYSIDASAGSWGSIIPEGTTVLNCGASRTYFIGANPCYEIANVVVDGVSRGAIDEYTFSSVSADHTITASFRLQQYMITATAGAGGRISNPGNVAINCGASRTYLIEANSSYSIVDVVVDGFRRGPITSYTFTAVDEDHSITANFIQNYDVSYGIWDPGEVECSVCELFSMPSKATYGETINIKVGDYDSCCSFFGWFAIPSENATFGDSESRSTTATIYGDVTLLAELEY